MDIVKGSVVKSGAGRDKGTFALVIDIVKDGVLICDGKHHKLENPKRKNPKHLIATKNVEELPKTNKQIRKLLNTFGNID